MQCTRVVDSHTPISFITQNEDLLMAGDVAPQVEVEEIEQETTLRVPLYHVVLLDDDEHTYDYVIEMLMDLFGHSMSTAYEMACEVDAKGRVIVDTTHKERAELKKEQIESYGPDWRIPTCKGSMSATIEPAK
jgi:ATP-dependent Clp protease adaptor protein ClpS